MVFGIFGLPGRAVALAVGLLLLGSLPSEGFLLDTTTHAPPSTGGYAYYSTYGSFGPDRAGFPAKGQAFVDPVFGSTIRRLTSDFPNNSASDIYARNGFWNADGTRTIHGTTSGYTIIDTTTGAVVRSGVPGNFDGSFAPDDPDTWYYLSGASLRKYSISSGATAVVRTFAATLGSLGGSTDWIDASGRYMVLRIGANIRVWDKAADVLYAGNIPDGGDGGWVGISPDGKYIVTTGPDTAHHSYAINHSTKSVNTTGVLFWTLCGDHGDLVSASDGKTYLVTQECYTEAAVYAVDVSVPQSATNREKQRSDNRRLFNYNWNDDMHFSGVSRGTLRDWAFISVESYDDNFTSSISTWRPYKQEIVMTNVLTGEVRRLAHHRSRGLAQSYYHQPRVSVSWDGAKVAWASNFGYAGSDYSDIYAIDVTGAGSGGGGGGDTTAPSVALTAPAASATISGVVRMTATASDNQGVVGLQFYVNTTKWGLERTVGPYYADWDTRRVIDGTYTLKAVARDAAGNSRTAAITVVVKNGTGTTTGTVQNVVWTSTKNVTVSANTVTKSTGCAGCTDAGGASVQSIPSGSGYVEFKATVGPMGYLGLRSSVTYVGSALPFALHFEGAYVSVYESGAYRTDVPFVTGNVFRIEIEGGVVKYKKNGTTFYTSRVAPTYPLRAIAALNDIGAKVTTAVIKTTTLTSGTPTAQTVAWTNLANVTLRDGVMTKSAGCSGCPDAGGRSVQRIASGRGYVQFAAAAPSKLGYVGLTNGSTTYTADALPFALAFEGRHVSVYESGAYRAAVPLSAGDVYRIAVSSTGVVSYLRNGAVFYRSARRATYPLRAAAALYDVGVTVMRAVMLGVR